MAIKVDNISEGKVIGIGGVTILPGQNGVEIPTAYEHSPILAIYEQAGLIRTTGKASTAIKTDAEVKAEAKVKAEADAVAAEELRKARLASLNGISEESLASLANELGINPATCKDQADVMKKVKAALK